MNNFKNKKTVRTACVRTTAKKSMAMLLTLALMLTNLCVLPAQASATDPVVSLSFNGVVADSANQGATFMVYDSTTKTYPGYAGADYGPTNDNTSSFGGSGSDTYWAWHSTSEYGGGLSLDIPSTAINNKTYTLGLRFSLDDVSGYKKVIDFKNRTADNGFYIYNGQVNFYTTSSQGSQGTFNAGTTYTFLIVRDDTAKTFKVFLDSNPTTPIFSLTNINDNYAVPDEVAISSNSYYRFGFFYDDLSYLDGASPSGKVYSIKAWNSALSDAEISNQLDKTAPSAPTVSPIYTISNTISGTAEANSTVTVTLPNSTTTSATVGNDGKWNITLTVAQRATLTNGSSVSATATDASGNISGATAATVSKPYVISTVAGNGSEAQISGPYGVAVDNSGNVYIADCGNNVIRKVDSSGNATIIAGTGTIGYSGDGGVATSAQLHTPAGIITDNNGNLYFSDCNNNCVRKIDSNGIITTIAGRSASTLQFHYPIGLAFDINGNLYIADCLNSRIYKRDTNGNVAAIAGSGVEGYSGDGGSALAAEFDYPSGVAVDNSGNVYVADYRNNRIRKIDSNGIVTTVAGTGIEGYSGDGGSAAVAKLYNPYGVTFDGTGNLYVADYGNNSIRKIDSNGIITTIAGTGTANYSGDGGLSITATLNNPSEIALDGIGNIYISDSFNNRIRKLIPATSPTATHVIANSTNKLLMNNSTLTGSYTYNSADGSLESGSTYSWVRYNSTTDVTGTQVGTNLSYTLTNEDIGKYLSFTVTPNSSVLVGSAIESTKIGMITAPLLTATPYHLENYVKLSWSNSDASQTYHYMVAKRDAGIAGSIAQTIPLKPTSHVLNVYPGGGTPLTGVTDLNGKTVDTSANVKVWMEANGANGYGKGLISVDCVSISDFNANQDLYLKDANGKYKYDVVFVGAWDSNNNKDISNSAVTSLGAFIKEGGGYLSGHDSGYTGFTNMPNLLNEFLNMTCNGSIGGVGSTTVNVVKKGLLTNYPWTLSGKTLTVPYSHTSTQFAMGDVWMKYAVNSGEITSFGGNTGTNNFYLTTWNNVAMIQTGHSNGAATADEQKVLANTLLYLSQVSTDTTFDDHSAQDVEVPSDVSNLVVDVSADNKATVTFASSVDIGNTYEYQLKAIGDTDKQTYTSDITTANITSGIKGYAVVVDQLPNIDPGDIVTTTTPSYTSSGLQTGTWYAHVKAIDNAGNVSGIVTTQFDVVCKPYVSSVVANSTNQSLISGKTLTASYTYNANGAGVENGSTYSWVRYDKTTGGTGTTVGTGLTYLLTAADVGKYLSFTVIPSNGTISGSAIESNRTGAIQAPSVTSSGGSSGIRVKQTLIELPSYVSNHKKYINGYPNGTFGPESSMTRAEFAQALFNLLAITSNDYTVNNYSIKFSDVNKGDWYENAVAYLLSINSTQGYKDGTFKPDQPITRAEAIAIITRITSANVTSSSNGLSDVSESWAKDYIGTAYAKKWVSGYSDGTFKPEKDITRAEIVTMINKVQNRKVDVADIPSSVQKFSDISSSDWYYSDVIEASNEHSFTRFSDTDSEKWSN